MKLPRRLFIFGLLFLAAACGSATPMPSSRRTPVPTWTLPFKIGGTPFPTPTPYILGPTNTRVIRTETPTPNLATSTPSPTARPGIDPTLDASTPDPFITPEIPVPTPVAQRHMSQDVINILLLGRDTTKGDDSYRTDVIIIASIDKAEKTVTLLSIPRDLFVYIPGWTMNRINTASQHGDLTGYPGGGAALLEQTILYNLGIPIHGWVRIDFQGVKDVVNILDGVDVPVSCPVTEWRLKDDSYSLKDDNPDDWDLYTVAPGVVHMDGVYALWYARSRKRSNDFARSRRQHQVLRAMFDKALQLDVIPKLPELYNKYVEIVDTDLGLGDILQFAPLATQLDRSRIRSRFIGSDQVFSWTTSQGANVLLPDSEAIAKVIDEALEPPSQNILLREPTQVEVWNGTPNKDWATLAADNLQWGGLIPALGQADTANHPTTVLYDFTSSAKGSARGKLQEIFHLSDDNVIASPDPNAKYPFRVVLGSDYQPCTFQLAFAPPPPTPVPQPGIVESPNIHHAAAIVGQAPPTDGDLAEWTYMPYPVNQPILGRENWQGLNDLSAVWAAAWDDQYLYLALEVRDDAFVTEARGDQIFKGDGLEIWIDTDPGSRTKISGKNDFQLGIAPGLNPPANAEAWLWLPTAEAHAVNEVFLATQLAADGYNYEVKIPWSVFHVVPFAGEGFAFILALNDDDSEGSAEQESQLANIKDAKLTDPTTWGVLVLDAAVGP
jgi:LCP family protein required for cell wall assembly